MGLIAELVFPQKCLLCGKPERYLCPRCQDNLPKAKFQICPECGLKSFNGQIHPGCFSQTSLGGLYSPFAYRRGMKKLLKTYKFELVKELKETITSLLVQELSKKRNPLALWQKQKYILVPLPLHPVKKKWRGFNQSLLVGQSLAKKLKLDYQPKLLKRIEFKKAQVGLSKEKRQANIRNQFRASFQAKEKNIILLDDVWTTGSTLKEAGKELKTRGAKNVWGLTFCQ